MRLSHIGRKRLTFADHGALALRAKRRRRAFLRRSARLLCRLAPHSRDVLTVVAIGQTVSGEIVPEIAGAGSIDIGFACSRGNSSATVPP